MATVRLTNMIRDIVKSRLLEKTYKKREEQNKAAKTKLADQVYRDVYPLKIRRQMEAMPEGFMCHSESFNVNFAGERSYLYFSSRRPIARKHTNSYAVSYPADHPLAVKWTEISREEKAINAEKRGTRTDIGVVLDQVTTLKKLIEIWPEVEPWVKDFVEPPVDRTNLPALPITELNKTLGLEKKTA